VQETITTSGIGGVVVQWVERWTCDQQVMGSNRPPEKAA